MAACIHHWRIESPNGQKELPARCVKCDASRVFNPMENEPTWASDRIGRAGGDRLPLAS